MNIIFSVDTTNTIYDFYINVGKKYSNTWDIYDVKNMYHKIMNNFNKAVNNFNNNDILKLNVCESEDWKGLYVIYVDKWLFWF